jgi:hypothetical protein
MKFTGWVVSAGLIVAATAANAQSLSPVAIAGSLYATVSDFEGPYAAMPPEPPAAGYYGGPMLLPPREVYAIVRESGFSPLGIPHQRGFVYTIAVIDRRGDDGRLVIDARSGRIIRFVPAYRMGDNFNDDATVVDGPVGPPPGGILRGPPRPPRSVPHVATRMPPSVPVPKPAPRGGEVKPLAAKPVPPPAQQSAAVQTKPADTQGAPPAPAAAPAIVEAKPSAPQILPTEEMPKVQGLE